MTEVEGIASRSMKSVRWNLAANIVMTACGFIRTFILARLLPVETFGMFGKATSFVLLALPFLSFGLGNAMLYRTKETEIEEKSGSVLLTLSLLFSVVWVAIMLLGAHWLFDLSSPGARVAFYAVILSEAFSCISHAPATILSRHIDYRRKSMMVVIYSVLGTILSILFGLWGLGIWSLVVLNITIVLVRFIGYYVWRPVMRFRPGWDTQVARFLIRFGSQRALEDFLSSALDRIDDMWTAARLGDMATGFYTQAHTVARYPLKIISFPVITVAQSTFSALKGEQEALEQAFEFVNSFLARLSFFIGGAVLLTSREFVILYLGDKWLPLLNVLRIMVLYMMIEPIKEVISGMFSSIGRPDLAVRTRVWQLVSLLLGLVLFAGLLPWGIEGVAIAVNISVLIGLVIMAILLAPHLRTHWMAVFLQPTLAVLAAGLVTHFIFQRYPIEAVWMSGLAKGLAWTFCFGLVELLIDRAHLKELLRTGKKYLGKG